MFLAKSKWQEHSLGYQFASGLNEYCHGHIVIVLKVYVPVSSLCVCICLILSLLHHSLLFAYLSPVNI